MKSLASATLLLCAALLVAGCSSDYEIAADYGRASDSPAEQTTGRTEALSGPNVPEPLPGSDASAEAVEPGAAEGPGVEQEKTPAVAPSQDDPRPVSTPPSQQAKRQQLISLSTGVALAQTLPTGTAMGFSVDYQFAVGWPGTSPYVWVIEPSNGQPARQPVQLKSRGNLMMFFPQFRPENGPFETHIEDANGNRVSLSVPLSP